MHEVAQYNVKISFTADVWPQSPIEDVYDASPFDDAPQILYSAGEANPSIPYPVHTFDASLHLRLFIRLLPQSHFPLQTSTHVVEKADVLRY